MAFSVAFEELDGFPQVHWERGIFVGVRRLKVAWIYRLTLQIELAYQDNMYWPYSGGLEGSIIYKVKIEPLGRQTNAPTTTPPDDALASYDYAVLTLYYGNDGPRLYGNAQLITESLSGWDSGATLPYNNLRWGSGAGTLLHPQEAPEIAQYSFVLTQTFHRVYGVPNWVKARMRRVNPAAYATYQVGLVFPAETMLYQPPRIVSTAMLWGPDTYDITVRYLIHPSWADELPAGQVALGWNSFWRLETARYESIYMAGGSRYIQYPGWTI